MSWFFKKKKEYSAVRMVLGLASILKKRHDSTRIVEIWVNREAYDAICTEEYGEVGEAISAIVGDLWVLVKPMDETPLTRLK